MLQKFVCQNIYLGHTSTEPKVYQKTVSPSGNPHPLEVLCVKFEVGVYEHDKHLYFPILGIKIK